jgi:hypothetical protein
VLGPFAAGTAVNYQRSVSFHQYLIISFQLIKMGWDNSSVLTIALADQSQNRLFSRDIVHTPNVPTGIKRCI